MTKWIFGIAKLVISVVALIGTSLIVKRPQQFYIEQFIILFPYILNYSEASIENERKINKQRSTIYTTIIGACAILLLVIALMGLFLSINSIIKLGYGKVIINDWLKYGEFSLPYLWIIMLNIFSISGISIYTIEINNY